MIRFAPSAKLRPLLEPVSWLTLLGLVGFFDFYWPRFLVFIASGLALAGVGAALKKRWPLAIPIMIFLVGTWAYNFFEGRPEGLIGVMVTFFLLLAYGFWTLIDRPPLKSLSTLHTIYLILATLVVWELAVIIHLFWGVEPWSRTFIVVAAVVFLAQALRLRLKTDQPASALFQPLWLILTLIALVIATTPIPQL